MANLYKNGTGNDITTTRTLLYTCPDTANTQSILVGLSCSNIDGVSDVTVDVELYDDSKAEYHYIGYLLPVAAGGTLTIDTLKVFLETNDKLYVRASTNNSIDAVASILEITED